MEKSDNKFKLILTGVFAFFILLGLVAFASFRSTNSSASQVTISIWGTVDQTVFDSFISKYEQDNDVQLKVTYTEHDLSTIDNDLVQAIATGEGPDVILIPQELMDRYLDKVAFITSIPQRTFLDTYINEAQMYIQPDGIFAVPFFVDPMVMYYNKDLFASAGIAEPPTSWSQFPLLASKLTQIDQNGNITQSVAALGEYTNVTDAKALLSTLIMQAGSPIVSYDSTTDSFASALYQQSATSVEVPTVSALNFFTDYSNPQESVYSWNSSLPSSQESFLSGNLAMYFGFASEASDITSENPNLNFDVAMIPQTVDATTKLTFGDLYGFAFLKSSPNTAAAFSLISTLTSASAVADFLEFQDGAPARNDLIAAGTADPQKTVFYNSALISQGWVDPDMSATDQIFGTMVSDVTTGNLTPDASAQKADAELNTLLGH